MRVAVVRLLLGRKPRALLPLLLPTALAVGMDLLLRGRTLVGYALQGKLIYASSLLISAAFWGLPLWCAGRLGAPPRRRGGSRAATTGALAVLMIAWVFPFVAMSYGGQALYHRVFHSYMGRDTLRLGIALRGTVTDWFVAWGSRGLLGGVVIAGVALSLVLFAVVRRAGSPLGGPVPLLLAVTFPAALGCMWFDQLDSRFLQAATPDTCFVHGVVHATRVALAGEGWIRKGMSLRAPAPLPRLTPSAAATGGRPTSVLVVLTESIRADALCSDPPPGCTSPFLDAVAAERIPLGLLTAQTPNTFSSFLVLTTGLAPNVDFASAHAAPVLWEVAKAAGYRTVYVSAQNPKYEDFGAFVARAGIDVLITGTDLGGMEQEQIGAPDERAAETMLGLLRETARRPDAPPYFAVLHMSNTHAPYRVDDGLLPFQPSSASGLGDVESFHNRYRNSVRLEERTVASLLREVRLLPGWDDTAVVLLSDHGEQFREHGGFFHNHTLYDTELRVPGWILAGTNALSGDQRTALASYAGHRTYAQDIHATLIDLLGVYDRRTTLPYADLVSGRSLLRPRRAADEPVALLATSTAVWEPDDARYGAMRGERVVVSSAQRSWVCFDTAADPEEKNPLPPGSCVGLVEVAKGAFSGADVPP